jgi:hypothetical protein
VCLSPLAAATALRRRFFPLLALTCLAAAAVAEERHESFDKDPGWDDVNNRAREPGPRTITQDFGYSAGTSHAGGTPGEMGGSGPGASPSARPTTGPWRTTPKATAAGARSRPRSAVRRRCAAWVRATGRTGRPSTAAAC